MYISILERNGINSSTDHP